MAYLVRGEMLHDKHHSGHFGPLVTRDVLVPWSPEAALWAFPASYWSQLLGTGLPWEAQGCFALVTSSSFTGGIFSKLPLPCSEQTLHFVPCQRTGLCPNLRRVLLRTLFLQAERHCLIGEFRVVDVLREPLHEVPVSWARTEARGASHH